MFSYYQATSYVYETTTTTNISTGLKMPQTRLESRLVFLFLFTNYFYLQICYQMTTDGHYQWFTITTRTPITTGTHKRPKRRYIPLFGPSTATLWQ